MMTDRMAIKVNFILDAQNNWKFGKLNQIYEEIFENKKVTCPLQTQKPPAHNSLIYIYEVVGVNFSNYRTI